MGGLGAKAPRLKLKMASAWTDVEIKMTSVYKILSQIESL